MTNRYVSEAYSLILNLANASDDHKENCKNVGCSTSLYLLRNSAKFIYDKGDFLSSEEKSEAQLIISKMGII